QKLTKKQRKALQFRQGRRNKPAEAELQEVPEAETLDDEPAAVEERPKAVPAKSVNPETGKKRKRAEDDGEENTKKKRKAVDGAAVDGDTKADGEQQPAKKGGDKSKKRYILFVGNLPKSITEAQISAHFSALPSTPSIRLRLPAAPKPGQQQPPAAQAAQGRAKIFAFLEFRDSASLQGALKLHRSNLGGKLINVELTVGGGGRGEGRREKLDAKRKQAAERLREYAVEGRPEAKEGRKE
ncbi:hypothetical protein CALCODRAFT_455914, partial [Calocera cornea HHB12733]